eukprot:gene5916-8159_t
MIDFQDITSPALVLISWSMIMMLWLYSIRIPIVIQRRIKMEDNMTKEKFNSFMSPYAKNVADNYNHLMEQPTIFYAIVFYFKVTQKGTSLQTVLAWFYVGTRIVHSLFQAGGLILNRFMIFMVSSFILSLMIVSAWIY